MAPRGVNDPVAPEATAVVDAPAPSDAFRGLTVRWLIALSFALTGTLTTSVWVAVRAGDRAYAHRGGRGASYSALIAMQEVRFEGELARTQTFGDISPVVGPRPRPTPARDPIVEPEPDPDDDGEEMGTPDPVVVTVVADRESAGQGESIVYTFTVENVSEETQKNIIAEMHIPSGTYPAGSCSGFADEVTMQPPACADVPGLPATGTDDYHVLRTIASIAPGAIEEWRLIVRVGADTPDGAMILEHCRVRIASAPYPSEEVAVVVT